MRPDKIVRGQRVDDEKVRFARRLRREMTPAEKVLWECLRRNQLDGLHFRRQQVIAGFIADFYCHAAGVVVELDGGIHTLQREADAERDLVFAGLGLTVLRIRNDEVFESRPAVLSRISGVCASRTAEEKAINT